MHLLLTRRYGTHFVCGIGYRGAFVGSINIRTQDSSDSYAAGAAFKASYGMCSGTADIKAKMTAANIDCEVKVSGVGLQYWLMPPARGGRAACKLMPIP